MDRMSEAPLVSVGRALAERGHYGFVWVDLEFIIVGTYGRIVSFVDVGQPLIEALPVLVGLENEICDLRKDENRVIEIPAISFVLKSEATPRLNLVMLWIPEQQVYLCVITKTTMAADAELDLAKEMRRRLIAEAAVKAKSDELERANQDLEQYAAVISHDLKAPMRALRYQVDDLEAALGNASGKDVSDLLGSMRRQTKRMSAMLSALLDYSAVGNKSETLRLVDTGALVAEIMSAVESLPRSAIKKSGIWPVFQTLEAPLDLVMRNLIDNAIKHNPSPNAQIEIHGSEHIGHFEFSVADNGPGIAEQHRSAIFLPFRTLTPSHNDGVQGLGLALVHRTISGVGGEITVEARADGESGAVFRVLWPKTLVDPG